MKYRVNVIKESDEAGLHAQPPSADMTKEKRFLLVAVTENVFHILSASCRQFKPGVKFSQQRGNIDSSFVSESFHILLKGSVCRMNAAGCTENNWIALLLNLLLIINLLHL